LNLLVTIYQSALYTLNFKDPDMTVRLEMWVIDDYGFMGFGNPEALGMLLLKEDVALRGMLKDILHPEADAVAIIKKSVWDIATSEEIEIIVSHEAAHFYLGHKSQLTDAYSQKLHDEREKQVDDLLGEEAHVIMSLFSARYIMLKTPYAKLER